MGTFNVENLDPTDPPAKFAALAGLIVTNLRSPDLLAIEEVQDNTGPAPDPSTDASITWQMLIAAIEVAGGPDVRIPSDRPRVRSRTEVSPAGTSGKASSSAPTAGSRSSTVPAATP